MPDQDFDVEIRDALRRGAIDEALAGARDAVSAHPDDAHAHRWLATALNAAGEPEQALASIDRAITLAPDEAVAHFERAVLLLGQGQADAAQAAVAHSITLDPNLFGAYVMQAQLALGRGDFEEVERQRRLAARIAPDHPQLTAIEAMLMMLRGGDAAGAQAALASALQQNPGETQLSYALGFAYMAQGHLAFAEQLFRNLLEANPAASNLRVLVAELVRRQGRPEEALAQLAPSADGAGQATPAMRVLAGELELEAGHPERAVQVLREALGAQPDNVRTIQALVEAWRRLGAADDARATLDAALATSPGVTALWHARLSFAPVDDGSAQAVVDRWLAATPDAIPALEARLALQEAADDAPAMEATARRILALAPGHGNAEMRLLSALLERDPAEAIARLEMLIAHASVPGNRMLLRQWLGLALDRAGRPAEAAALWAELQADAAPQRLPLPAPSQSRDNWPALAPLPDNATPTAFLWGAPGSGVDRVAAVLDGLIGPFRGDRHGPQPPRDLLQNYASSGALAYGTLEPAELIADWQAGLRLRGISNGQIIDWLPWWDNSLLLALRPHLPGGMLLVVLRDPRDMLLDWLGLGTASPAFGMTSPLAAAQWLAQALEQVVVLRDQALYPHRLLQVDQALEDPAALALLIGNAIESPLPAPQARAFQARRFPAGHWRRYAEALAEPFAQLTPVARQLGYE